MTTPKNTVHPFVSAAFFQLLLLLGISALPSLAFASGIAAGLYHTCVVTSTGGVQCWGFNSNGQLGDNTLVQKLTPVAVSGLSSGVVAITAGGSHTCALSSAGGVQCWGSNYYGQLGDNTYVDKLTPVAVSGLSSGVVAITAGGSHTCALTSAGGVQCWGDNTNGGLGDNTRVKKTTPVAVSGLSSGVVAIAAGSYHTCALISTGGVQCWGRNDSGQLGDTTTVQKLTPVAVSGLSSGVVAIAAGSSHTCAVTNVGGVQCWGYNASGQLGDDTSAQKLTPVAVSGLSSGVQAVTAGDYNTCALTSAGGVQCWGYNSNGQLGDNTIVNKSIPVAVSGLSSGMVAVAAGFQHTCALTNTNAGGVKCWGANNYGQLGDNTTVQKLTPVNVVGIDADDDGILDATDPDDDNDGVLDGADNCPVTANADQLDTDGDGVGNACDTDDDNDGVPDVSDKFPLNAAASSDIDTDGFPGSWNAACDVTCQANSGLVLDNCPSNNNANQLDTDGDGIGNVCDSDSDNDGVPNTSDAFPLDATESVDTDGDGIGNNADSDDDNDGVLDGADNCPITANADQTDTDGDGKGDVCEFTAVHIAAAQTHTCSLTSAGGVKCWGQNYSGILGDNTTVNKLTPVAVSGLSVGVAGIAASETHTCAFTTAGVMMCWGNNYSGQLGDNTSVEKHTPVAVSGLSSGVVAIATGRSHTCALTSEGGVKCWGNNDSGQLGDNTAVDKYTPVAVSGLSSGVVAIATGYSHTCALTSAGGVKCWGDNSRGQLGDNTIVRKLTPVAVSGLSSGVVAIATGYFYTCALTSAGGVKCWGFNSNGQLGDNTLVQKLTPVAVSGLSSDVVAITAGGSPNGSHTCALTNVGGVKCWGFNSNGQLGDNTLVQKLTPVAVSGLSSGVVAITAGGSHTCALTNVGGVKCWGFNDYGELGDNTFVSKLTPVTVNGSFYITDSDGDGVPDYLDAFPLNAAESVDTDGDGIGNNADPDDDNDGLPDVMDPLPLQAKFNLNAPYKGTQVRDGNTVQ